MHKILIVDDHADIRDLLRMTLELAQSFEMAEAVNGEAAVAEAERLKPDLVLMDIMMPEMDGFETMREIRKIPSLKNLPIIAVTAKAMKGDRERCIEAGAWDYLSKPVDTEQMLTVLRAWLHR